MEPTRNQFFSNDVLWLGRQQVEFDNAVRDLPTPSVKAVAKAFGLASGSGRKASEALRGWREVLEARHGAAAVSDAYVDTRRGEIHGGELFEAWNDAVKDGAHDDLERVRTACVELFKGGVAERERLGGVKTIMMQALCDYLRVDMEGATTPGTQASRGGSQRTPASERASGVSPTAPERAQGQPEEHRDMWAWAQRVEDLLARQQTTLNAVCGEVRQLQVTQEEFARLVGQRETGGAGGAAREGGARSGETPAEQVVAAIRALDATQPSGLKWTKEHEAQRTRAWAAAGLLKGPLGDAEAAASLDLLVLVVARLKGWGAAITAKGLERDGRGWAAVWKGASLQERVQMVRDAANLSARELTVEAQRRKKGREEKREDRRQKDATQPKQEEAGAQRAAGTAPVETAGLADAMLRAFSQGQQSVGANRGPAAAHVRAGGADVRERAAAHAGAMGSRTGPVRAAGVHGAVHATDAGTGAAVWTVPGVPDTPAVQWVAVGVWSTAAAGADGVHANAAGADGVRAAAGTRGGTDDGAGRRETAAPVHLFPLREAGTHRATLHGEPG